MDRLDEFNELLNQIISILKEERQLLIKDDAEGVIKIVEEKNRIIGLLQGFKGINIVEDSNSMKLIEKIDELQETNLLLTKQALSFQDAFIDAVVSGLDKKTDTYSAKGDKKKSTGNLVDQSV